MTELMDFIVLIPIAAASYWVGHRVAQPMGWRLFRRLHRNNPEALAFADRHQPKRKP